MAAPESWRETGASPAELREFHAAAAAFFTRAPWTRYASDDALLLELPGGSAWIANVLTPAGVVRAMPGLPARLAPK
jgi:hypothetical protein